jgi:hypothetical protein
MALSDAAKHRKYRMFADDSSAWPKSKDAGRA